MNRLPLRASRTGWLVGLVLVLRPSLGVGDPRQCIETYDRGVSARDGGRLRAALKEFTSCASTTCPEAVQSECSELASKVESNLPTVVFGAIGPDGNEAENVRVTVDGELATTRLDGRALPVDPGRHQLRFEAYGRHVDQVLIAREGEKNRAVLATFARQAAGPSEKVAAPRVPESQSAPVAAWVLGGIGVAALGSFAYFAIAGRRQETDMQKRCAPDCTHEEVDDMQRAYLFADVSLGISFLGFAGATYLFLTNRGTDADLVGQRPSRSGVGVSFGGQF